VIGWMEDLDAATLADVQQFFATYYAPNNASLAIAGDVDPARVIELVENYFGGIASGPAAPEVKVPQITASQDTYITLEDDVTLPRLYMGWHTPALFAPGDAEEDVAADVLGSGKAARLYTRLVHELEIAQDVAAYQDSGLLGSSLQLVVTAREGVALDRIESETRAIVASLAHDLSTRELERARNHIETATVDSLQSVGGFGGKADRLNHYFFYTGDADYLARDVGRYDQLTVDIVRATIDRIAATPAVAVSVVPRGALQLAAGGKLDA
jgi:zinc protease